MSEPSGNTVSHVGPEVFEKVSVAAGVAATLGKSYKIVVTAWVTT